MIAELFSNPILAGSIGLLLTGGFIYLCKEIPKHIWNFIIWFATVNLTITGNDKVYEIIDEWFSNRPYAKKVRTLKLSLSQMRSNGWCLSPGFGTHIFWDDGLVILRKYLEEKIGSSNYEIRPKEIIHITVFGRKQNAIRTLINQAEKDYLSSTDQDTIRVYFWEGYNWNSSSKSLRSLDTIFLPKDQKNQIVNHTKWFFENKEWFEKKMEFRIVKDICCMEFQEQAKQV